MKKIVYSLLILIFLFTLYGCPVDKHGEGVLVENNADYDILVCITQAVNFRFEESFLRSFLAKQIRVYGFSGNRGDIFYVLIVHPDTVSKYPWETIVEEENFLRNFKITRGELKKAGYTITYP